MSGGILKSGSFIRALLKYKICTCHAAYHLFVVNLANSYQISSSWIRLKAFSIFVLKEGSNQVSDQLQKGAALTNEYKLTNMIS